MQDLIMYQEITPYEYQKRVEDGTITNVLADHKVKAGDVLYLPAGRVEYAGEVI